MAEQIYQSSDFASRINTDEETIVTYVTANPGKTLAEIQLANAVIASRHGDGFCCCADYD